MSFCAKGKHRLVCLSNRACEATVVVVVYVVLPVEQGISEANVPTTYQSACRKCTAFRVWSPKSQAVTLHFAASHTATNDFFFIVEYSVCFFVITESIKCKTSKQKKRIIKKKFL